MSAENNGSKPISNELEKLLGTKLVTNQGEEEIEVASLASSNKIFLLYFSAHWCPPCKMFTPKLSEAYEEYKKRISNGNNDENDIEAELIFVSSDTDIDSFKEYHKTMSFPALPYDKRDLKEALSERFGVQGIPTLVAMDKEGNAIECKLNSKEVDFRSLIDLHGASAFPFTEKRLSQLEKEAKEKRAASLKALVDESNEFTVMEPGVENDVVNAPKNVKPLFELMAEKDYVSLLFGDGDFSDPTYSQAEKTFENVTTSKNAALVYIGWSLYNEESDHSQLAKRFLSLPNDVTKEQKDFLTGLVAGKPLMAPTVITLRKGSGLCHLDGTCEEAGVPVLVSVDPMMGGIRTYGATAFPWDEETITKAEKEKKDRIERLKTTRLVNFDILRGDGEDSTFAPPTDNDNDARKPTVDDLVANMGDEGVVGLYFSAHWCPPCQAFTPKLVKSYEAIKAANKNFEIVFVSSDNSKEIFEEYYASMVTETGRQWLALDYDQRDLIRDLGEVFDVDGIPFLVFLKKDGTIITQDGVGWVRTHGAEAFPWDDGTIESAKQKEQDVEEQQRSAGGVILKRLKGEPGCIYHDVAERTLSFPGERSFSTVGAPGTVTKSGVFYYEMELEEKSPDGLGQFGFILAGHMTDVVDEDDGLGVGDDGKSWAVDGYRGLLWHNDETTKFNCSWENGDVVGLAVNADMGEIAVSKNGSWSKEDGCGVVFQSDSIKSEGVYPAFSNGGANKLRYTRKQVDNKYKAPPAEVWNLSS